MGERNRRMSARHDQSKVTEFSDLAVEYLNRIERTGNRPSHDTLVTLSRKMQSVGYLDDEQYAKELKQLRKELRMLPVKVFLLNLFYNIGLRAQNNR